MNKLKYQTPALLITLLVNGFLYGQISGEIDDISQNISDDFHNAPLVSKRSFLEQTASGKYTVWYGCGEEVIDKPFIYVEGIDPVSGLPGPSGNQYPSDSPLYGSLYEELLANGYDVIQLDFDENPQFIERNSLLLVELIERLNIKLEEVNSKQEIVVMGESMGAIITRYALAWMEKNNVEHNVKLYVSFDGPNQGANVPWALQYLAQGLLKVEALGPTLYTNSFLDVLLDGLEGNTSSFEAMFQLLRSSPIPVANTMRTSFLLSLNTVGQYPVICRKIAVSNGANNSEGQEGLQPKDPIFKMKLIDFTVNGYFSPGINLPVVGNNVVYTERSHIAGVPVSLIAAKVPPTMKKWDVAPGGYYDDLEDIAFDLANILTVDPIKKFTFIPMVSALDLNTSDPYYDLTNIPNFKAAESKAYTFNNPITPFDAIYASSENTYHVSHLSEPHLFSFLKSEIAPDILYVQGVHISEDKIYEARDRVIFGEAETEQYPEGPVTVSSQADIEVRAGSGIDVKPGAHVKPGVNATFKIQNYECSNDN